MAAGSCVNERAGLEAAGGPSEVPTYSVAQGDRMLAAFERANPQCPLWTNWQKLCSRTGPGGATHCATDPDRSTAPSEPFCARTEFSGGGVEAAPAQLLSSRRFCEVTRRETATDIQGRVVSEAVVCGRYQMDRPFNGRRAEARRNPACAEWSRGESGVLECRRWAAAPCPPADLSDGVPDERRPGPSEVWIPRSFDPDRTAAFGVFCRS